MFSLMYGKRLPFKDYPVESEQGDPDQDYAHGSSVQSMRRFAGGPQWVSYPEPYFYFPHLCDFKRPIVLHPYPRSYVILLLMSW